MRRHQQTLAGIEQGFAEAGRPLPEAEIDPGFNEFDHGAVLSAFLATHPQHRPIDREAMPGPRDRMQVGGVVAQLAQRALEVPDARSVDLNIAIRNSAISEFVVFDGGVRLLGFNQLPHLSAPGERKLWTHF